MKEGGIRAEYTGFLDIKHPRMRTSAYGHEEAKTSWSIRALSRPQGRWCMYIPYSC